MGVYGTTYKSAFSGLGKPSIKLEFEDNESLVAFSKKMQDEEPAPVQWNEEEEMFVPVEGVKVVDEKNITEYLTSNPADFIPPEDFNEASFKNVLTIHNTTGKRKTYIVETPLARPYKWIVLRDYQLEDKLKEKNSNWQDRTIFKALIKPTLENPRMAILDDKGLVFVKPFTNYDGKPILFCVTLVFDTYNYVSSCHPKKLKDIIKKANSGNVLYPYGWEESRTAPSFNATVRTNKPFKVVEICLPFSGKDILNVSNNQTFSEKNSLEGYGDFYTVRDMRKRSRKEPGDVATNKNLQFTKDDSRKMNNFDRSLYELTNGVNSWDIPKKIKDTDWRALDVTCKPDNGKCTTSIQIFFPYKLRYDLDKPTFTGYAGDVDVEVDLNNLYNYSYYVDARNYIYKQRLEGFVKKDYYKELFIEAIKSGYKQLQQRLINIKNSSLANSKSNVAEAEKLIKYYKMFYSDPSKYDLLDKAYGGNYNNIREKVIDVAGRDGVKLDGVTLGKTANDTLYNNNELMDCRGLKPTYKILQSYDAFFAPAQHSQTFAGVGLDDTKKLIADICKAHYKDCARIAQHLKADTKLQSVFNLWHWLRHNIRYEYDREGREEVRTPLRTWADRRRGVDCDCLSVFAWCVLKCMGYDPAFELVCFKGKKQPSHILVNLDGIRCDRVWFVFNSLPPGVTNSEIYRLTDRATAAQLAGLFN